MTNEELAQRIKAGETDLTGQLWEQVKRLLYIMINRLLANPNTRDRAESAGVTRDDLKQEAYFAMLAAIDAYDPDRGLHFVAFLKYHLMSCVFAAISLRTSRQRGDPGIGATSLDEKIGDVDGFTFIDQLPDLAAADAFDRVIDDIYLESLHVILEECLSELPDREEAVIRARYYEGTTQEELASRQGVSSVRIGQIERKGLEDLRRMNRIQEQREEIIGRYAYKGGLQSFKDNGASCVERAVIKLEELEVREAMKVAIRNERIDWAAIRVMK